MAGGSGGGPADLDWADETAQGLLDDMGPLWFRPAPALPDVLLQGVVQVCGHTPLDGEKREALGEHGFHVVDPTLVCGVMHDAGTTYRYAIIEGGTVRVEEGVLVGSVR